MKDKMKNKLLKISLMILGGIVLAQHFLVINNSPSLPEGLYLKTWKTAQKGDTVLVSPPDSPAFREALKKQFLSPGLTRAGTGYLIKKLAATGRGGDEVSISPDGIRVNGDLLADSRRQPIPFTHTCSWDGPVPPGYVLLYAPHSLSFDSRYFGLLSEEDIVTPIIPLITRD